MKCTTEGGTSSLSAVVRILHLNFVGKYFWLGQTMVEVSFLNSNVETSI
jgi:hypothetical protein